MIKTSKDIQQIYRSIYPNMAPHYAIPFSEEFEVFKTFDEAFDLIKNFSVAGIKHIKNKRDCEKRAWKVVGDIQWYLGNLNDDEGLTKTIGWIAGYKMPFRTEHTIITTYSEDRGVINIDPLKDSIENPDINKFDALLLVM